MRSIFRQTAVLGMVGFALGLLVGLCFLAFNGIRAYYAQHGAGRLALHLLLSGVVGAVNMGTTTIYTRERWGLLRCTLTHFCCSMSTLLIIGFFMGWFDLREPATLWILAACVAAYFIIWLVMFLLYRRQVRRINEALRRWKEEQEE